MNEATTVLRAMPHNEATARVGKSGQMLTEFVIVSLPVYILLFQAIIFFGQFVLSEERVNVASRYSLWRIRQRKDITAYKDVKITRQEISLMQGENIPKDLAGIFSALADTVNDTLKVRASAAVENTLIPGADELNVEAVCVVDGSSWKISDALYLLKKLFDIPQNRYYNYGDNNEAPPFE